MQNGKNSRNFMQGSPFITEDLLLSLYPHLTYGDVVWGSNYMTRLDSLIKMQKEVVRVITLSSYTQ